MSNPSKRRRSSKTAAATGRHDRPSWPTGRNSWQLDSDLEEMSRDELLGEYDYELNFRAWDRDPAVTRGRRILINNILCMRWEREEDMSEMLALPRSELLTMAKVSQVEYRHRMNKHGLATILLVGY